MKNIHKLLALGLIATLVAIFSACELNEANYLKPTPLAHEATTVTPVSFTATWSGIVGSSVYIIDVSPNSDFSEFVEGYKSLEVEGTSIEVTGLEVGTTYYFRVSAKKDNTLSQPSNSVKVITRGLNTPVAFDADQVLFNGFRARWSSIKGADKYTLQLSKFADFSSSNYFDVTDTTITLSDLDVETEYYYHIRAFNQDDASDFSNIVTVTTSQIPAPGVDAAAEIFPHKFTAVWSVVPEATSYTLEVARDREFTQLLPDYGGIEVRDTAQEVRLFSIMIGKTHYYRVKATGTTSVSEFSEIVEVGSGIPEGCKVLEVFQADTQEHHAYEYDGQGRLSRIIRSRNSNLVRTIEITYDADGKVEQGVAIRPNGRVEEMLTFNYDGEIVSDIQLREANGSVRRHWVFKYDYNYRVTRWDVYDGTDTTTADYIVGHVYSYEDNMWTPSFERNHNGAFILNWQYAEEPNPTVLFPVDLSFFMPRTNRINHNFNSRAFIEVTGFSLLQSRGGGFQEYTYEINSGGFQAKRFTRDRDYTYTTECGFQ